MSAFLDIDIRSKRFGSTLVLENIRLRVAAGEVVALVGASGCGKSTLLRIVAGLETDYAGSVALQGRARHGVSPEVGFIFQEPRLFPWLTVAQNVAFDVGGRGVTGAVGAQVSALLAEVGLAGYEQALPKQLSGGQAQRVAIARGLFRQPRLLLLDEPFSAVDAFTRIKLQELIVDVARAHAITLLVVTHDIDEAAFLGDRVLVMDSRPGRLHEEIAVALPRPRDRASAVLDRARAEALSALHGVHAL